MATRPRRRCVGENSKSSTRKRLDDTQFVSNKLRVLHSMRHASYPRVLVSGTSLAALASITVLCWLIPSLIRAEVSIPPHRPIHALDVHSYTEPMSVAAGEVIRFHVSSTVPYQLSIYRLGTVIDNPSGDELVYVFSEARPVQQAMYPGSYIHVDGGLKLQEPLTALTLECWVKPFRTNAWAGLITEYDYQNVGSFSLMLSPGGRVAFYLGDGGSWQTQWRHQSPDKVVRVGQWHHVIATWDGQDKTLWVDAQKVGQWPFSEIVHASGPPLRLATRPRCSR